MRLRGLLLTLLLLVATAGGFAWLALTPAPALEAGPLIVEIPAHQGLMGIADRLARADDVVKASAGERLRQALGIEGPSLEGYLFPDTYQFVRGMSVDEMLTRMVQRMRGKLTPEVQARARERGLSVHQLLTLASIIEREAVDPSEQKLISAVFWNRLRLDMPLQADPTVQYSLTKE